MTMFETYVYPMMVCTCKFCYAPNECPAIIAERKGVAAVDTCKICEQCFNALVRRHEISK